MNEAETRAELIDPKLKAAGWGVVEGSKVLREYHITAGKIQTGGVRAKPLIADYVLVHQNRKLAVIEAKSDEEEVGEGVAQARITAGSCNWKRLIPAMEKRFTRFASRPAKKERSGSFPHRRNSGTKPLPSQTNGARSSMPFRLKMSAAQRARVTIRKSPSTKRWPPSPTTSNASC